MSTEEEDKWVYLMAQKYEKIKFKRNILKANKIFAPIISNIEKSIENKNAEIVIFLPLNFNDLHNLLSYLTTENPMKLKEVNCSLENLLSKLTLQIKDPEEVVKKVELPTDEWILLADDFIRSEYPELSTDPIGSLTDTHVSDFINDSCDPEKLYSNPWICSSSDQDSDNFFFQVKQRALNWLKPKIHNNSFIGKLSVDSLIKSMIPGAERYSEEISPCLVKYFIKWHGFEFHGTGKHLFYAKEDAAIDAVSQLLDINLKSFVPPSKSKLYGEIMRKIKLDEVLLKSAKKTYEMSVKLPLSDQVVKGQGSSLFSAKQKTFILACRQYSINKNMEMESLNKSALIKFYNKEKWTDVGGLDNMKQKVNVLHQNSSSDTLEKSSRKSLDSSLNSSWDDCRNDNEVNHKTDSSPSLLNEKEKERLKFDGLIWIKSNLKKNLYDKVKPDEILHNFLPKASLSVMKADTTTICKVKYKTHNWICEGWKLKETKENVVIKVLKEVFDIQLVPVYLKNFQDLKRKLEDLVKIRERGPGFISTLVFEGETFKLTVPSKDRITATNLIVQSALSDISTKHKLHARMSNRKMFSAFFINEKSPLLDRVKFVLDHFTFNEMVGKSRFESTDWLLDLYERTLLDEIDKNIQMEPVAGDQFQATTLLNRKELSYIDSTRTKARARIILKVVTEMEKLENEIVVEKPFVVKVEDSEDSNSDSTSSSEAIIMVNDSDDNRDVNPKISFYRKRALDIIGGESLRHRCEKGLFISPKRVLTEVLGHVKLEVISNIKYDSFDHQVTINFCGELVEGKGHNEHVAKQNACRLVFINVLKIDWDRAVHTSAMT